MKTVFTLRRTLFGFCSRPFPAVMLLLFLLGSSHTYAQKYLVGDGFGGRSWYKPGNITAGVLSTGTINGQLYMWGTNVTDPILPIPYNASPTYPISGGVDVTGLIPSTALAYATVARVTDVNLNTNAGLVGNTSAALVGVNPYAVQGFNNVKLVSVAYGHNGSLIKSDSTGWIWGESTEAYNGLRGAYWGSNATDGVNNIYTPLKVISNAKFVSAGDQHIVFVKYDGTVWTLGDNYNGAYGNGTIVPDYGTNLEGSTNKPVFMSTTPVQMTGITNAVRVAVFGARSANSGGNIPTGTVILKADGTVWVTGGSGFLQPPASARSNVPTQVGGLSNIVDIKCSGINAIALTSTGDVYVWGAGTVGPTYADGNAANDWSTGFTYIPKKINFPLPAAPMVAIEANTNGGTTWIPSILFAIDENHQLWKWGISGSDGGNLSLPYTPVIEAKHVVDISIEDGFRYVTRTSDYPVDERLWQACSGSSVGYVNALNPDYYRVTPTPYATTTNAYFDYVPGKYWANSYNVGIASDLLYPCHPGAWGLSGIAQITATGNIDCSKTSLLPVPVQGTASTAVLQVTVNVTVSGEFTPTVSGSGLSLVNPGATITATTSGTQVFYIPVKYDGSTALTTATVSLSPANPAAGCTLTLTGSKPAIINIITTDCVPTVGPKLQ